MIHGLAALGKLDDFVWTPKVLIRDQVIRSCIMNNDDSQTFKNTIGIKVQNMKMDFKTEEALFYQVKRKLSFASFVYTR